MSHETRLIRAQAQTNRINQFTPFGSLTFSGGPLNTTANLELDPQTQQLVDQLGGATMSRLGGLPTEAFSPDIPNSLNAGQLAGQFPSALDPSQLGQGLPSSLNAGQLSGQLPSVGGQGAGSLGPFDQSTQAQQAVFRRAQSLLDPQFERQEERLRQTLANQGLPTGSEAFNDEFGQFNRDRNRAFEEAAFRAVVAGNQRQNQLFGQGLQNVQTQAGLQGQAFGQGLQNVQTQAGLQGQAFGQGTENVLNQAGLQGQAFGQGLAGLGAQQGIRNQNFGEVEQLLGLRQAATPGLSQFFSPGSVDTGPDASRQIAKQNRSSERDAAALGGLAMLGAAIFSDRRLKRYIRRIGEIAGLPLYVFQYIWGGGWQIGHMADEVEKMYPDAVIRHKSGYLMVDYSQVWG